jgi:DNA-binding transcriptional LysR family regulator
MEMQQVRYFLAVARALHFTRAAEECNVTQPSLTRAIKQLEDELGGDLFRRERPHAIMTDLGERMQPLLKQCYESALSAKSLAASIKKGEKGSLKLVLSHTIDLSLLAAQLAELRKLFGNLELKLLRGTGIEINELLKRGDAELAVSAKIEAPWERLDCWPLFDEGFYLIAGRNHRLASRAKIDLEDLRNEHFLTRPYCEQGQQLANLLRQHDIDIERGDIVASELDLVALLQTSSDIAIVPRSVSVPDTLIRAPLPGLNLRRTVCLYGVAGRERGAAASAVMKMLRGTDWSRYLN